MIYFEFLALCGYKLHDCNAVIFKPVLNIDMRPIISVAFIGSGFPVTEYFYGNAIIIPSSVFVISTRSIVNT